MAILTDLYNMAVGGMDASKRWRESDLNNFRADLDLYHRMNPEAQYPSEDLMKTYYKLFPQEQKALQQQAGQSAQGQQSSAIPGLPSTPGQQSTLATGLGQQAMGQQVAQPGFPASPEQPSQDQSPLTAGPGRQVASQQQGQPTPPYQTPGGKPITTFVSPDGKQLVQGYEGDSQINDLITQGWQKTKIPPPPRQSALATGLGQQVQGQQPQPERQGGILFRQPQQQAPRRPMLPQGGVAAFDVQTGKPGPITYYPQGTKVFPTNATPKGITWMIDSTGEKPPVQTFEGDPNAQNLANQGYVPMPYAMEKERTAQTARGQANTDAYHKARLEQDKNKPDTAQQHKEAIEGLEKKRSLGETLTPDEDATLKAYYKVNPKPMGSEAPAFEEMKPEQQKLALMRKDQLLRGLIPYPDRYLLARQPDWNTAIQLAQQDDPNFSAATYPTRLKTRISFTSGKDAQNITSINTLVGHLDSLNKSAKGLGNTWSQTYNYLGNYLQETTGNPKITQFNMDATAVENEFSSVFKGLGGAGTDQETKEWRKNISSSKSQEQLQEGVVGEGIKLLKSRLEQIREKYKQGMGTSEDLQVLRGPARKKLESMIGKEAVDEMDPPKAEKENQGGGGPETPGVGKAGTKAPKTAEDYLKSLGQ